MHALSRIHRSLRSGGVLLDVHPEPENSRLEIWQDDQISSLGEIEQQQDSIDIKQARDRLGVVESHGLFASGERRAFEMLGHYATVEDWLDRWAEEGWNFAVTQSQLDSAQELLAKGGGELVIRERIRATALKRLTGIDTEGLPHESP